MLGVNFYVVPCAEPKGYGPTPRPCFADTAQRAGRRNVERLTLGGALRCGKLAA